MNHIRFGQRVEYTDSPARLRAYFRGVLISLMVVASSSFAAEQSTGQQTINSMLDQFHEMASQANFKGYFELYHPEGVFIGTDAEERWDLDAFKAYAKPHFDAGRGWTYRVVERHLAGQGDVRWFDELLWNDKLGPCRGSGVIEKYNGQWRVRHYVLSLAVPNEIAEAVGEQSKQIETRYAPAD